MFLSKINFKIIKFEKIKIYAGARLNKLYFAPGKENKEESKNIDECVLKPWFKFPKPKGCGYSVKISI